MTIEALESLSNEMLDELISADIDGELTAALQDLELSVDVAAVQSWFTTSSRGAARYQAMQTAAMLLKTTQYDLLDEVSQRRMVNNTLGQTAVTVPSRVQRLSLFATASAACAVLVVGIGMSLNRSADPDISRPSTQSSRLPSNPEIGTLSGADIPDPATDLGTLADIQQLRTQADLLHQGRNGPATTTTPNGEGSSASADLSVAETNCAPSLPGAQAASAPVVIVAVATVGIERVAVATTTDSQGRTLRWAYRRSDCAVLFSDRL